MATIRTPARRGPGTYNEVVVRRMATLRWGHEPGAKGGQALILDVDGKRYILEAGFGGNAELLFEQTIDTLVSDMKIEGGRGYDTNPALCFYEVNPKVKL